MKIKLNTEFQIKVYGNRNGQERTVPETEKEMDVRQGKKKRRTREKTEMDEERKREVQG